MHITSRFHTLAFTLGICVITLSSLTLATPTLATPTLAQPAISEELSFVSQTVSGATHVVIDADYAKQYGIELPTGFTFQVPQVDDTVASFHPPASVDDALLHVEFKTPDGQLIEEIRFFPMDLPIVGNQSRLERLTNLLVNGAYSIAIEDYRQHTFLGARQAIMGTHDAIEVIGEYLNPELGPMLVHIVGILNPNSSHSIFSVANFVGAQVEITNPDDFATTNSGALMQYFEYFAGVADQD